MTPIIEPYSTTLLDSCTLSIRSWISGSSKTVSCTPSTLLLSMSVFDMGECTSEPLIHKSIEFTLLLLALATRASASSHMQDGCKLCSCTLCSIFKSLLIHHNDTSCHAGLIHVFHCTSFHFSAFTSRDDVKGSHFMS